MWTEGNDKRLEGLYNYHQRDMEYYDNFRPFYENHNTPEETKEKLEQILKINNENFAKQMLERIRSKDLCS